MISSEVQRTLVKSPPELWAEISDPESLARHLGEFGEIRITRVQPEQKVEWETDDASGTVVIKPSGWGTKVKLTVLRELAGHEPADGEAAQAGDEPSQDVEEELERDAAGTAGPALGPGDVAEPHDTKLADELAANAGDTPSVGAALEVESPIESGLPGEAREVGEPDNEEAAPHEGREPGAQAEAEPRRGFFARLFGRRRASAEQPGQVAIAEPAPEAIASEPIDEEARSGEHSRAEHDFEPGDELAHGHDRVPIEETDEPAETVAQPPAELVSDAAAPGAERTSDTSAHSAEPQEGQPAPHDAATQARLAEEIAAEEVTAVLTGVLDRLGAAHHRPFSRA